MVKNPASNRGFSRSHNLMVSFKFTKEKPTHVAMVMENWEFWHKISYNLDYIRVVVKNLASNSGF